MSNQFKERQKKNQVKKLSSSKGKKWYYNNYVNTKDSVYKDKLFKENCILELRQNLLNERKKYRLIDNHGIKINKELAGTLCRLFQLKIKIDQMEKNLFELMWKNEFIRNANFSLMRERNVLKRELNDLERNGIAISSFRKDILKNNADYYRVSDKIMMDYNCHSLV